MSIVTTIPTNITNSGCSTGGTITGTTSEYIPIVDRILKNKFQLYNRTREKLSSEIKIIECMPPFQLITDYHQSGKKLVLTAPRYKPCIGMCTVDFIEYDNTTNINLIEG